ncbi:autotransporter outer membrane beta-barrel domain-containing protein [Novosphingobium sp. MMS21-SN21R]|uniref:autotransporter outer membrane beta-barrel domain-containing protein n=1 Tax=Novosphingobium sp. MMS21-SN21R TaxID=2969298 RepID=UPI0028879B08|nr:autotransporter outer membrane beta-barrel domain-containing protein [Novosphingobium sp. MMS21-SN21R]MDT0506963.1 autotransporter outer membrane beta-barrel domain-containing protein [Novosphingobium sp. MMS21-SN21R]
MAAEPSLTTAQNELLKRCRAVVRASGSQLDKALGQITSDELLAQDAALRGAALPQTAAISARLSGMSHFSNQSMGMAALSRPVRFASSGAIQSDASADYGVADPRHLQFFGNFNYSGGNRDATSLENGFDMDFVSVVGGLDYRVSPEVVVGGAFGYGHTRLDFDNKDGNLRSSAYTAALYTMIQPDDRLEFSLLAAYSRLNYRGARSINYTVDYTFLGSPRTDSPQDTLTSRTHANQVELSGSTFYNLGSGAWTVGPAAQVSWTRISIAKFAEEGPSSLGFAFPRQVSESLQFSLGIDGSKAISTSWGIVSPYARARAVFETADRQRTVTMFYVNDPFVGGPKSPGTVLTTTATDRTRFQLGAGVSAQLQNGIALMLDAQTLVGMRNVRQYGITAGIRVTL